MAGGSALLTFVILASFAVAVGVLTTRQLRRQFESEVNSDMSSLFQALNGKLHQPEALAGKRGHPAPSLSLNCNQVVHLPLYAFEKAQIRIFLQQQYICDQTGLNIHGRAAPVSPLFGSAPNVLGAFDHDGYRVETRDINVGRNTDAVLLYARPLSDTNHTVARFQFFLLAGVLGGTILALLAGLATAQRAIRPIRQLTAAAREIERTRDPRLRVPHPPADDEIAELARTLEGMLDALDSARGETEAMLERQREFIADASHELRTPLTSVLANLELLAEELGGEQAETAHAALRSTRRMRRLVGDLLLLARADAGRAAAPRPTDLAGVLTEVAAELGPVADGHALTVDAHSAMVSGTRDDLHRLALNLIENAFRHTPPGTRISASTYAEDDSAFLVVEDDGPGIPRELEQRVFERFIRGGGEGARGSGLGLAIVRAVAESHGGTVTLERLRRGQGTRFVIRIPALISDRSQTSAGDDAADLQTAGRRRNGRHTSTTTGRTIGRRRSRS